MRTCPPGQQSDRFIGSRANKTEHSSRGSQEMPVGTLKQTTVSQAYLQENSVNHMSEGHPSPRRSEPKNASLKATATQ